MNKLKKEKEVKKRSKVKDVLAFTNPIAWAMAVPIGIGMLLASITNGTYRNMRRILREVKKDIE